MIVNILALFSVLARIAIAEEELTSFSIEGKCTTMAIGRKATTVSSNFKI
jgi:hypothetical protein